MIKINQNGIAPIILLLLLLAGVTTGTVIVKNGTNNLPFAGNNNKIATDSAVPFPEAAQKCLTDNDCKTGYYCKTKDLKPLPAQSASRAAEANFKREYGKCHKIKDASGSAKEDVATKSGKSKDEDKKSKEKRLKDSFPKNIKDFFGIGKDKKDDDKKELEDEEDDNDDDDKDNSGKGKSEDKKDSGKK